MMRNRKEDLDAFTKELNNDDDDVRKVSKLLLNNCNNM
jgi:hypothetical protein